MEYLEHYARMCIADITKDKHKQNAYGCPGECEGGVALKLCANMD